jgi:N-acetylmuramoyl-L-alanine amidase
MPTEHRIRQGECISSIAARHGLSAEAIWDDPANAALKEDRQDFNVLYPGDVLVIPDRELKEESGGTEERHRFRKKAGTTLLRMQLLDEEGPRANLAYTLEIDGHFLSGTTDGDGKLEHPIPAGASSGSLLVEGEDPLPLSLGDLDPIATVKGVQERLLNLGYECGPVDGQDGPRTQDALRQFQRENDLEESGEADDATRDKLVEVHGS